jgi:hypothetical protein
MSPADLKRIWNPRYPLTQLEARDFYHLGMVSILITIGFAMFHFMGSIQLSGRSALVWLVHRWGDQGIAMGSGDYSHGFLVPIASLYVTWIQRDHLIRAPKKSSRIGLIVVCLSLLGHYMGVKSELTRLSILSLIGLCWSIPY